MIKFFTSESVTEGHPDKLCDLISDSILDAYLAKDKHSRVACETMASKNMIVVTGEITSKAKINIEKIVRNTIKEIGYFGSTDINYKTCEIIVNISKQSPDIALGTNDEVGGAGDQGMMFGYACDDTKENMPIAISLAHALTKRLTEVRKKNIIKGLGPDGKAQVTVKYNNDKIDKVDTILISTQHLENIKLDDLTIEIKKYVIDKVIPKNLMDKNTKILINPTGRFVIGGPLGDSGLTGRKIIVDTYGGYAHHGGGAFSGKDPSKVDRSAAYMARYVAKNIVANGYAKKCEIQIAYAIGKEEPVSFYVNTFNTGKVSDDKIIEIINNNFDFRPKAIIKTLDLLKPRYTKTTNYGHFGKKGLPWEKVIKIK